MSSSMVSKNPPPAAHGDRDGEDGGGGAATAVAPVTSCLYLHRPGPGAGALDKDAVLRRIRHRRRANRLRDTLRSMLQAPPPEPDIKNGERQLAWLDDAFSAP
ncbi:uncharacterized protein LOC133906760 [Phragmites australis]|uniref:uncharacterized protein LOC133906760 n=1 Tax=Phragmites australis TaxID=29695 RepID=UPI002D79020A|nr:uncharacterized protein LOC133906760 [Phragmites australis]